MTERLLVYSAEQKELANEFSGFLVQVNLGEGHEATHYDVDNIFALESWSRFNPGEVDWKGAKINVLGTFGSLKELRETYLADVAVRSVIDEKKQIEDESNETDLELYHKEITENPSLAEAVKETVISHFDKIMKAKGISIAQTNDAISTVRYFLNCGDGKYFEEEVVKEREKLTEQSLWKIFDADNTAILLPILIEYYDECLKAPYTFLVDAYELDPSPGELPYHTPRIKLSQAVLQEIIGVMLEDIYEYNDDNRSIDGQILFSKHHLARAREIVSQE